MFAPTKNACCASSSLRTWLSRGLLHCELRVRRRQSCGFVWPCSPGRAVPPPRRYGGAYIAATSEPVDTKPAVDKKCSPHCTHAWEVYKQCEARIEEKVRAHASCRAARRSRSSGSGTCPLSLSLPRAPCAPLLMNCRRPPRRVRPARIALPQGGGQCTGYYMDYFKCIDHCASKYLFKTLE